MTHTKTKRLLGAVRRSGVKFSGVRDVGGHHRRMQQGELTRSHSEVIGVDTNGRRGARPERHNDQAVPPCPGALWPQHNPFPLLHPPPPPLRRPHSTGQGHESPRMSPWVCRQLSSAALELLHTQVTHAGHTRF